ncbi:MAG TPA: dipicolinate synthase subunit B [Firmicutes bacterium]|nr:dipicolinate synthase subunit B [Bacillota bacterium]
MDLAGKRIGWAFTASHCTLASMLKQVERLVEAGADVIPILSRAVVREGTRFGSPEEWRERLFAVTGKRPLETIAEVEPLGPKRPLDVLVIAPCTGNTLAKLAHGITDGPVLMAAKAHLRNGRPVVLAVSTNDGLGLNAKNLGLLLNAKHIYFVPFGQDSPFEKRTSLVAREELILDTIAAALEERQLQPVLLGPPVPGRSGQEGKSVAPGK